jgi:hypothetical protein
VRFKIKKPPYGESLPGCRKCGISIPENERMPGRVRAFLKHECTSSLMLRSEAFLNASESLKFVKALLLRKRLDSERRVSEPGKATS